jgi:hypothetical protein
MKDFRVRLPITHLIRYDHGIKVMINIAALQTSMLRFTDPVRQDA